MNKTIEYQKLKAKRSDLADQVGKDPNNKDLQAQLASVNQKIADLNITVEIAYSALILSKNA